MYPIIKVDRWIKAPEFVSGTKEKTSWLKNPNNEKEVAMFKETIDEYTGETWSEKIASEVGPIIGIPTHRADIGEYQGKYGSLVWKMIHEDEGILEEGGEIITGYEKFRDYDRDELVSSQGFYSFQMLYEVLGYHGFLPELFDMVVYDALIGNTDRHQDNFGFIFRYEERKRIFAPLYDNASSLGRELLEFKMGAMLIDKQRFEAYLNRATTYIRWGLKNEKRSIKHFELIQELKINYPGLLHPSLDKVESLTKESIIKIVDSVPTDVMSDLQKEFVIRILLHRRNTLLSYR